MVARVTVKRRRHRDLNRLPMRDRGVEVGVFDGENAEKAMFGEFGTTRQAERPFLRNTMREGRAKYLAELAAGARAILRGHQTMDQVLSRLGRDVEGDMRRMLEIIGPANDPDTVARKGFDDPLVEDGDLRGSIDSRLK